MSARLLYDIYAIQKRCLLGVAFLIVNRRYLTQILKDRRMIVVVVSAAVCLLPMLVKRDWQLMYFSVLLCLLTAVLLSYFLTLRDAAKYYVVIMSVLGSYSVLAAYILRIGVDRGAYAEIGRASCRERV